MWGGVCMCVSLCQLCMCGGQWVISFQLYVVSRGWLQASRLVRKILLPAKLSLGSVIHYPIHTPLSPSSFLSSLTFETRRVSLCSIGIRKLSMKTRLVLKQSSTYICLLSGGIQGRHHLGLAYLFINPFKNTLWSAAHESQRPQSSNCETTRAFWRNYVRRGRGEWKNE